MDAAERDLFKEERLFKALLPKSELPSELTLPSIPGDWGCALRF